MLLIKFLQVYFKNTVGVLHSVAHEMLHFIFYDFLEKNYPEFDDLAFERPEYEKFKPRVPSFYPQLQSAVSLFREKLKGKPFKIQSFMTEAKIIGDL